MKFIARIRRIAHREMVDAATWYESQTPGLGSDFLDEIRAIVSLIEQNPFQFAIEHNEIRAAMTTRFPYVVYFRLDGSEAIVLAILHGARDPSLWRDRN